MVHSQRAHANEPMPLPSPDQPFSHPKHKDERDPRHPPEDAPGDDTPGDDPAVRIAGVRLEWMRLKRAPLDGVRVD
jgi:hypothetical protein